MCQAVSEAIAESKQQGILLGRNEGIELGKSEGKMNERLQCVIKMMNKLKMTSQEAMNVLDIPQDEQRLINDLLKDV